MSLQLGYLLLAAVTWFMTGLTWFVQIVHYPLFAQVGTERFVEYARLHCNLTGSVVVIPMIIQLLVSFWLAVATRNDCTLVIWVNLAMVVIIWAVTAIGSIPCHNSFCDTGFSQVVLNKLVSANWIRTILWTVCSFLITYVLLRQMQK